MAENVVGKAVHYLAGKIANFLYGKCRNYIRLKSNLEVLKRMWEVLEGGASDIKRQVLTAELSGRKTRKKEVDNWLKKVEKINTEFPELENRVNKGFPENLLTGGDVKKMMEQVAELLEERQHFNELWLDDYEHKGWPLGTKRLFGEKLEEDSVRICLCLVEDGISNIGIHGMGGVGKTTLATDIHNRLLKKSDFQVCWFTVSQEFSLKSLQLHVAKSMGINLSDEEVEVTRAAKLKSILEERGKNLVLILDDVWEAFCLESVGIPLGERGCKVILTTRSLQLCNRMDCQRKFGVNTLHRDEAWELFKYTLGRGTILNAGIEEIAKSMTKRCDGLPLGIITIAGSMKGIKDIHHWRAALEELKSYSKGNSEMDCKVFSVLEWSFNRLSKRQQNCFLYCSLYPEDREIPREELISLFIAARLLDRKQTRKQEFDQGHKILDELVSACLLEETTEYGYYVKMHDLIRDMAIRITDGEFRDKPMFMVKAGVGLYEMPEQEEWAEDLNVVSLMDNYISEIAPDMSPNCSKLSILILKGNTFLCQIPSSFFAHMIISLEVLDLSFVDIEELPNCVSDMENLTALLLRYCNRLQFVPPLGKLRELRELDISVTACRNVPEGLEMLVNLRSLRMEETGIERIPEGTLARHSRLQCLTLPESYRIPLTDAKALKELEEFRGRVCSVDVYNQLLRSQQNYCRLNSYYIEVCPKKNGLEIIELERDKCLILRNCSIGDGEDVESDVVLLPQNIKALAFELCSGKSSCLSDIFPQWNASIELVECQIHCSFEQLEFLLNLSSTSYERESRCSPLQSLENLYLQGLPNLIGLIKWGESGVRRCLPDGALSNLKRLEIGCCDKITKLFTPQLAKNLQCLDTLHVSECDELEEIIAEDEMEGLELITAVLPKLKDLDLDDLPELKSICNRSTISSDTIVEITVVRCPKLKRLPLSIPTIDGQLSCPKNLNQVGGEKEWWESLEWDSPGAKIALQSKFKPRPIYGW